MKYAKAIIAVLGAAVTAGLGLGLTGNIQQILTIVAAVLTAAGVYAVPNAKTPPTVTLNLGGKSVPIPVTVETKSAAKK